ncbi:hypothetical protein HMPREF9623_01650 [Stomatobaculum longum]|uniref:Uridine kinase n=1 Tax=Stomatobaculum longum TaxID=796942 RepID=A0AA37DFU9_9FIRM|nr:hypothetical protein [Stomatobaculum longum]EHO16104.1 hypothetical protein HMPREF9623_01650 [Stomatobaculum longum]
MDNFERLFDLLSAHPRGGFLLALDGRCASGKTTMAERLQRVLPCNVIHMDDFYLPFSQRAAERMAEPGGHIWVERLRTEVLEPLRAGRKISYLPYDCHADRFLPPRKADPVLPTLVEGSYSCHPALRVLYDCCVFLDITPEYQRERLLRRNPESFEVFQTMWIPREEYYFKHCEIRKHCNFVLTAEECPRR